MLSQPERPRAPAFLPVGFVDPAPGIFAAFDALQARRGAVPVPAPLPSLRDALQRRAALFGPVEAEPAPAPSLRPWQAIGDLARRVVDMLTPPRALA